ncbi:M15 family metallopeptidase [Baekduia soli]|uniref:M15 family metallopeptidase n=1 Tax=Baekduia soli TaxID=496014 RepID=A0A5B8U3H8_9ACTN|nr:D-alanyl-D-alanine carboxypeptidase family protein [Baekduia soli]QEC47533.1 M15 family metallopeptidase [Baekduia soli]
MTYGHPARTPAPRIRLRRTGLAGLLVVLLAALVAALGHREPPSSPARPSSTAAPADDHRAGRDGALGEAGGAVPAGATVFDGGLPGVANLDPALLAAVRRAATDAANAGVRFVVNGGWRSPAYEDQLRREAVATYGSEQEAARWVATGTTSAHVSGDAVDLGPAAATAWLSAHGAAYGLCPVYANEPWHYELRPQAVGGGCPAMYPDPTHDPRMQR